MQNSLVTHLRSYYLEMFKDISWMYQDGRQKERDLSRLLHELEVRGSRVGTLDLPALGKHFDRCLDQGSFTQSGLFLSKPRRGTQIPIFLSELYLRIFDLQGKLRPSPSHEAVAVMRQLFLGLKKLRLPCGKKEEINEVHNFFDIEKSMRRPTLDWSGDYLGMPVKTALSFDAADRQTSRDRMLFSLESSQDDFDDWGVVQSTCDIISAMLGDLDSITPNLRPKHGPGVVSNLPKTLSKYSFPEWPKKLETVYPFDYYGTPDLGWSRVVNHPWPSEQESPSRLIAVPKTMKGPRLIGAEPVQHQWIQQLLWQQLEAALERTPISQIIHFRDQSVNQEYARRGSVDGSLSTIDLSSASDRLSCWTVERSFRNNPSLLERLHACRTRWMHQAISKKQEKYLVLKKFGMMGSAVTFPVQSIVYAMFAVASVLISEKWKPSIRNIRRCAPRIRVFGDDIIVPTTACPVLVKILTLNGLKVNESKSFSVGNFRESCGSDWFKGTDVSPFYLLSPFDRATPGTLGSLIQQSNNCWKKGLWNLSTLIETTYSHYAKLLPIVGPGTGFDGRFSYCGDNLKHLRSRYSETLHKREYECAIPFFRVRRSPTNGYYHLLQYFTEAPSPLNKWMSGLDGKSVSDMRRGWISQETFQAS